MAWVHLPDSLAGTHCPCALTILSSRTRLAGQLNQGYIFLETWRPITVVELEALVAEQEARCSPAQRTAFASCRVSFYSAPFQRSHALEQVLIVAKLPSGLLYYEDVEEGFEVGALDADGILQDHGCNQWELTHALSRAGL